MAVDTKNFRFGPCNVKAFPLPRAEFSTTLAGDDNDFTLRARLGGVAGNAITIALIDPSANDAPLTVTVTGTDIVVSLATGVAGAITSTARQVIDAINAHFQASGLVYGVLKADSDGTGIVTALAEASLSGGSDTGVEFDLGGLGDETTVTVSSTIGDLTAAQLGTDPVDGVITGGGLTVAVPMKEFSMRHMAFGVLSSQHLEGADGLERLDFVIRVGESVRQARSTRMKLVPIIGGVETSDPNEILTLPEAGPTGGEVTLAYGNTQRVMAAVIRAWPSPTGVLGFLGPETL